MEHHGANLTLSGPAAKKDGAAQRRVVHSPNGTYGTSAQIAGSLRFDVGRPDHLAPLLGFLGNELPEVGGRARKRGATQIGKARLDLGIDKGRVDLLIELVDDLNGRVLRHADAPPPARLIAR